MTFLPKYWPYGPKKNKRGILKHFGYWLGKVH
jgi:hypothetical protein